MHIPSVDLNCEVATARIEMTINLDMAELRDQSQDYEYIALFYCALVCVV